MGKEIVYCHKCQTRLLGSDFEKGKAFRHQNLAWCADCARGFLDSLPAPETSKSSSNRVPILRGATDPPSSSRHRPLSDSTNLRAPRVQAKKNPLPLVLGAAGGALGLLLLVALAASGSRKPSPPPAAADAPPPETPRPAPPPDAGQEREARRLHEAAKEFARANPGDLGGQLEQFRRAAFAGDRTSLAEPARRDFEAAQARLDLRVREEVARLEEETRPLLAKDDFKAALRAFDAARVRITAPEWTRELDRRAAGVREAARFRFLPLRAAGVEARQRRNDADLARVRQQVAALGLDDLLREFDESVAVAIPLSPAPPPPPEPPKTPDKPALSPVAKAYRERFSRAADHALARDYAAAAKLIEEGLAAATEPAVKSDAQADLEAFRAVQALLADAAQTLSRWPRGQNLAVELREAGGRRRIDEPVRAAGPHRVEVRDGRGALGVEFGEVSAGSLAELWLSRAKRSEAETRTAALFCALEGDLAAAKRLHPEIPDRYLERAAASATEVPREAEARKLHAQADLEHRSYATRAASLEKFARLLADFKETAFVRRNQASLAARADTLKELYFGAGDLRPAGVFSLERHPKGGIGWTASEDVTDKAQRKDHFVEAEFSAPAGSEYRAWVLAGGCCVETFSFFLQASDLEAPDAYSPTNTAKCEPGSTFFTPVVPSLGFLRKQHAQHGGPKEPSRFDWIALPALKFAAAGTKKLRVISDQQGFTASALFLSSVRRQPPREAEAADLDRARPDVSALLEAGGAARSGVILREAWTGIPGDGIVNLVNAPAFKGGRPTETTYPDTFVSPRNWADAYGTRLRGYVLAPQTGAYTFFLCTDDDGKLFISTDENPANKVEIGDRQQAISYADWNAATKSPPVNLVKGRRYYIEALHKEGGGNDHLLVGWQLPDGTMERPIPGPRLSAFIAGSESRLAVALAAPAPGFSLPAPGPIAIQAEVAGPGQVSKVEIVQGSTRIGEAKGSPPSLSWSAPAVGAFPLQARLTEKGGRTIVSKPVLLAVGEISFHRAVDLNGADAISVDELPWQAGSSPDVQRTGIGFERQELELRHATDPARARMIRSSVAAREGTKVSIPVPPGKYLVYLTAWEPDDGPLSFDVLVNGKTVVTGHRFAGAGDWARLGPWPAEGADGKIEVASRGFAHFSGIEIWRHGPAPAAPSVRTRTEIVGGPGGAAFEEVPEGNRLITGLRLSVHEKRHVKTLQALYGGQEGEVHGQASADRHELIAKPGYALGALQVRGGDRILAFQAVFMRVNGPVLNPADRYESGWIVGDGTGTVTLGGTGAPIVGLQGRRGNDIDAVGLVFLK